MLEPLVDRIRARIERWLPWWDTDAAAAGRVAHEAQIQHSRDVRAKANTAVKASRRDRAVRSYRRTDHAIRR